MFPSQDRFSQPPIFLLTFAGNPASTRVMENEFTPLDLDQAFRFDRHQNVSLLRLGHGYVERLLGGTL
jgi:hypothetical protein